MSMEALNWAMPIQLEKSSWKFVLVCMANRARSEALCFQSIAQLVEDTCLDRKTVLSAISKLCDAGLILDTKERVGVTKQIIVYRLAIGNSPINGSVSSKVEQAIVDDYVAGNGPKIATLNGSKNGTVNGNGTVPFLDANSPVFDSKQSRFSVEQSQKRDTETIYTSDTSLHSKKRGKRAAREEPAEFEVIRSLYPKRAGDQGWVQALGNCNGWLEKGATWQQMTDGVRRYAAYCTATNSSGSIYVKAAKTFFGPEKHFAADWSAPSTRGQQREDRNISASLQWLAEQEANDASH